MGPIASGVGPGVGVRFADVNNDGRADFIWMDEVGKVYIYLNVAGQRTPIWDKLNGGEPLANGIGGYRKDIHLVDVTGDGKAVSSSNTETD